MEILLELNQKFGSGFQIRFINGPVNMVYDKEPLTIYEAGAGAAELVEQTNKATGTNYKPWEVLRVTNDALEANASKDFGSAKMLRDVQTGQYKYSTPAATDFQETVIDGEEQVLLTGRGTVLTTYACWKDDGNARAREALMRYCQYIASHGRGGGATRAFEELDALETDRAVEWIRQTYARHVHDDAGLIQYVLGNVRRQ